MSDSITQITNIIYGGEKYYLARDLVAWLKNCSINFYQDNMKETGQAVSLLAKELEKRCP